MKRYTGKQTVEPGLYLNLRQLAFEAKDAAGPLPGEPADIYRRVNVLAMLAVAPLKGIGSFLVIAAGVLIALRGLHAGVPLVVPGARPGHGCTARARARRNLGVDRNGSARSRSQAPGGHAHTVLIPIATCVDVRSGRLQPARRAG